MSFLRNPLINTDSYKGSHPGQYPEGFTKMFSYIESRGGKYDKVLFVGLQAFLIEYLSQPFNLDQLALAAEFFDAHGVPFPVSDIEYILKNHGGKWPVKIRAVKEGSVVPVKNALVTIESTDPKVPWVVGFLETALLRAVWYPCTVATQSKYIQGIIKEYVRDTADDLNGLEFMLHDFGARGVSSTESSAIGGMAHLVNFKGSDTVMGVMAARVWYKEPMAAFSVPAAEHSTITSWGRENERDAYRNMLRRYGKPNAIVSVVSDSYDIYNAVDQIWGVELRDEVIASGAMLVIRPDSGYPSEVVLKCAQLLDARFGSTLNSKGYKVLNYVRIIQGDGVNDQSIREILQVLKDHGFSAINMVFGMGGKLLQGVDRDTMKWAMKCSAVLINDVWIDVYKDPVTDPGKQSKRGRMSLYRNRLTGEYSTFRIDEQIDEEFEDQMIDYLENGNILVDFTFSEIRDRASAEYVRQAA